MELEFDIERKKVILKNITIYDTDDIYLKYARRAATRTSFDSIFSNNDNDASNSKVRNFYKSSSPWYERKYLEQLEEHCKATGEDIYNVIYMLYNDEDNSIYVGKADRLIKRLREHMNNKSDPMLAFTHFRYSEITEGYEDYSYIIENSAIHDLACIFDMPNAKTYRSPLSKIICKDVRIQDIIIKNKVETQTKMNRSKKMQK